MRSDKIKKGIETMPHRSLLRASGLKDEDFKKPFIGVANSYNNIIPGHVHLNKLAEEVKRGIRDAGGVPLEWGVPGVCDGVAMFVEMRLSLPSREHIADNIEIMTLSHSMDGWIGVTNCDKITPGMLMASGRLNLPNVIITGGPMKPGNINGKKADLISNFEVVGAVKSGKEISEKDLHDMECKSCPGEGSCAGLFTANSMACMTEVLGLSVKGCATTLAVDKKKLEQAYESGKKIVELVKKDVKPRDIVTENSFHNAVMVDMAIGGSTNTALHLPKIAEEFGIDLSLEKFDELSRTTPNLCKIRPSGPYFMEDLDNAGGIPAVLNRLLESLKDADTISGNIKEIAKVSEVKDDEVLRPLDNPFFKQGGIAVLKGNLANSSVIKQTAISKEMMKHKGPAKVFNDEHNLLDAIENKEIEEGDIIVINFMGPKGAPGMPEMLTPTSAIMGAGYKKVALITDGRFSGGTRGPCLGHIEPEAYDKGVIGLVKDGDMIEINIPERKINLLVNESEIEERKKNFSAPKRELTNVLKRFRENA